jgi:S1-C subfamily serine protease
MKERFESKSSRSRIALPAWFLTTASCLAAMAPLAAAGLLGSFPSASAAASPSAPQDGKLEIRLVVVAADLSLKPVPKHRLVIVPQAEGRQEIAVTTGFDGSALQVLSPGRYRIHSESPVEFEGKRFSWDVEFEIREGKATSVELSNDNARTEAVAVKAAPPQAEDAGALYERFKGSVFKIIADGGHGSGFLISSDGLILTNHHVVVNATFLAAKVDDRHKYLVKVLSEDANRDLAVLRIHPDTVQGRTVLPLAEGGLKPAAVSVGERVIAIGSPLSTETILTEGVVSKVQDETITSDVNINPGNSGGPLLNHQGLVIGITTYGIGDGAGPGLSGITRIHLAEGALSTAREAMKGGDPPSPRQLPVESAYRFTPDSIREMALARSPTPKAYHLEAGKMDVQVFTPVLVVSMALQEEREAAAARQKRKKGKEGERTAGEGDSSQHYYTWQKDEDVFLPVVRIRVYPEIKITAGSAFMMGMLGTGGKYRFKTDFDRMELRRGEEVIEPIHPGRIKEVVNVQGSAASMKDIGYWGLYEYPPEAFNPGAPLTLKIWEQGVPEPRVLSFSEQLLESIRADYRPYLESLSSSPSDVR